MDDAEHTERGGALTDAIITALIPVVADQPTELVIQALAGAFTGALITACPDRDERLAVLLRYAARLCTIAEAMKEAPYAR
jgi:hypothetical protein